jgi:hypothetical protein
VDVHEFQKHRLRTSEEYKINGDVYNWNMPAWGCRDLDKLSRHVAAYLAACQKPLKETIYANISDPLFRLVWEEANRYAVQNNTEFLKDVSRLFTGAMFNSRYPKPLNPTVFGVGNSDPGSPTPHYFEDAPLPPFLTFQIQSMVAEGMQETQHEVIEFLKARIFKGKGTKSAKRKIEKIDENVNWYETFLGIACLLAMAGWIYDTQLRFRDAHEGLAGKFHGGDNCSDGRPKCVSCKMSDEWVDSASILIYHFRGLMKSEVPCNPAWRAKPDHEKIAALGDPEKAFISRLQDEVDTRREELNGMRGMKHKDRFRLALGFLSELFLEENWEQW